MTTILNARTAHKVTNCVNELLYIAEEFCEEIEDNIIKVIMEGIGVNKLIVDFKKSNVCKSYKLSRDKAKIVFRFIVQIFENAGYIVRYNSTNSYLLLLYREDKNEVYIPKEGCPIEIDWSDPE